MNEAQEPYAERRHLGHLISGWHFQSAEGVASEDVFMVCNEMAHIPSGILARVHAEGRAVPPLDTCGWHDLGQ